MLHHFPIFVLGEMFFALLNALTAYIANVAFLQHMVSAMIEQRSVYEMIFGLVLFAVYQLMVDIYSTLYVNICKPKMNERINKWFYYDIKNAVKSHELYFYDNPAFYDDVTYVSSHIFGDAIASVSNVSRIISNLVNIILILSLFSQIGVVVLLIACLSIILSLLFDIPIIRLNNKRNYDLNSINREKTYFYSCFFSRSSFMERKMTGINELLNDRYLVSIEKLKEYNKKCGLKIFALSSLKDAISSNILLYLVLFVYLLYKTLITHELHGSDFISSYNAVNIIVSSIMSLVSVWESMMSSSYTIEKYNSVKVLSTSIKRTFSSDNELEKIHSIELRNVTFTYPETERLVLDHINMKLVLGDKIAIVGKNGSGKTTLVHLLMGLYKPTSGEILINGRSIKEEEYPALSHQFAAFFQGMMPFEASVAENVALDVDADADKVKRALTKTKSDKLLSVSLDQMIGVLFDDKGLILSGGEFQKLMLSYCFYSDKSLIIMDEPTSALDPISERNFNNQVEELSEEKLTVFVTHRLSTVHMASCIYVIDNGKICDYGTHAELMQHDGVYKDMWTLQAQKYCLGTDE